MMMMAAAAKGHADCWFQIKVLVLYCVFVSSARTFNRFSSPETLYVHIYSVLKRKVLEVSYISLYIIYVLHTYVQTKRARFLIYRRTQFVVIYIYIVFGLRRGARIHLFFSAWNVVRSLRHSGSLYIYDGSFNTKSLVSVGNNVGYVKKNGVNKTA